MAEKQQNEWQNKEVGVLWKREKKSNGEKFLTGKLDLKNIGIDQVVDIVVFQNKKKEKDTHPDLRIYKSEPREGAPNTATAATAAPVAKKPAAPKAAAPAPEAPAEGDNEII